MEKKTRSPVLKDFGQGFYALWSFSGQQYKKIGTRFFQTIQILSDEIVCLILNFLFEFQTQTGVLSRLNCQPVCKHGITIQI